MKKIVLLLVAGSVLHSCSLFKRTSKNNSGAKVSQTLSTKDIARTDSSKKDVKAYKDIITNKAITKEGLCKVHQVGERYFFEIRDSLLNKDLLIVNRISKGAAESRVQNGLFGYAGDYIGENVVQFVKGPNRKLFIKRISYLEVSNDSSENGMYRSILNSTLQPIVASFDIKALSPDSAGVVIDITDYINGDNDVFFFGNKLKRQIGLGAIQADRSYIQKISSFPRNTEIKTVKTYISNDQPLTYELNSSIVLLPSDPMKPRYYDARVGFFARGYFDYDFPQRVKQGYMITRWRMEPREEDIERYKRGELVEPKKPIIFYIDPATPKKWVPYLIQGVNAWQKCFEKAGFKNAIQALEAPTNDSTWSLEDARHNVIVYKASNLQNASGPQVSDPRSGEILESHINWYHNVQQLLHDWYFVQASPNDPLARKMTFDDALMGELIKYVCVHEVGHTLGLQHNFMASTAVPVDSLRSKHYIEVNSHTPSIMDYARFNYVAQPEDKIKAADLIPRIGVYDEWAIEWGYKWLPEFKGMEDEKAYLGKWIVAKTGTDKRLLFNNIALDLRVDMEDLGDDPVKAGHYGIKNLKLVSANLKNWTKVPNDLYTELSRMNNQVIEQYKRYIDHVVNNFLGAYWIRKSVEQDGPLIDFPSREKLRGCIQFFHDELFDTPLWIDNKDMFLYVGGGSVIEHIQAWYIHFLVSPEAYNALHLNETYKKQVKPYVFDEFLTDMEAGIFKEVNSKSSISFYRRNLQKVYITRLINNIRLQKNGFLGQTDFTTILEAHLEKLYKKFYVALPAYADKDSKLHLSDVCTRLKVAMDLQKKNYPDAEIRGSVPRSATGFNNENIGNPFNILLTNGYKDLNKCCWESNEWKQPLNK